MKLSAVQVRNAKPTNKAYKLADGKGLYLHISKTGKKTWRYRYRFDGKETTLVLGEFPQVTLEVARRKRAGARDLLDRGKNPAHERRKEKQEYLAEIEEEERKGKNSFENLTFEWWEQQLGKWSKEHADAVLATLRRDAFPVIGSRPVSDIAPPEILKILRSIEARGSLEIASKVLQRVNAVFRYGVQTGRIDSNPAAEMKGVLKTRKVNHRAAISREGLPHFLKDLSVGDIHQTTRLALQFTILTAARSGEVRGATWKEINIEEKLWKIPAERMKMATPHSVPLSRQAMGILEEMGRLFGQEGIVFPGIRDHSKSLSENTMLYAMYRLGYHSRATVHGFRATFSTIANESGFDGDVIEKALAHEQRNKVRAAYHRSEYLPQRRELMQWWADLLQHLEHGAEIIPIGQLANK
ncbi:tyrosine-type recombinase/integrase [Desulfogranum marinum]|uniref:tyrosine-type recombinase/integrase n=1 Tax=Desulfogranum marinum TaxID=453220 RepID=UPI001964E4D2|nr:integrase arm-type DNA-binding domain-containing protein [Desulfogranum marinum]MBM9514370.1 tyrosine-type recombinase/integrase [Desulfogranum marinum]